MRFPNLVFAISERRFNQADIAQHVGITESQLSRRLNGYSDFSEDEKKKISKMLDLSAEWLFRRPRLPKPLSEARVGV